MPDSKQQRKQHSQRKSKERQRQFLCNWNYPNSAWEQVHKMKSIFTICKTNSLTGMAANITRLHLPWSQLHRNPLTSDSHTAGWSLVERVYPTRDDSLFPLFITFSEWSFQHRLILKHFCKYVSQNFMKLHQTQPQMRCMWQAEEPLPIGRTRYSLLMKNFE